MNDRELLSKIGLSDEELRDLLEKLQAFIATLNPQQKRVLEKSLVSSREAAESLKEDVSPKQLEKFIRERSPEGSFICIFRRVDGGDDD